MSKNRYDGAQLIQIERDEQSLVHKRFVEDDVELNTDNQLAIAAQYLANPQLHEWSVNQIAKTRPYNWSETVWLKMATKPYKERLVIAGALIAAEIDRLNYIEDNK